MTTKAPYSVADGRALADRLEAPDQDIVAWLCDRIEELEKQLSAKMGQVEGVCSICGERGWYVEREGRDPSPSPESVVGMIGSGLARLLAGQVPLHNQDGALICAVCIRKPT
jgi:hypothetical protein